MAERICRNCGAVRTPPIEGRCPGCGGYYRTLAPRRAPGEREEEPEGAESAAAILARHADDPALRLRPTGMRGVDHVFGGGLPQFGAILLSAKEGTGKSSFLLELFLTLAAQHIRCLFVALEQRKRQLVQQFQRFGHDRIERAGHYLKIDTQKELFDVLDSIERARADVVAVDSVHWVEGVLDDHGQPMKSGSAGAVERVARDVQELCNELGCLVFLVGHMNNDGTMAGGHALRHAVDATLGLRRVDEDNLRDPRRVLRFETKTRWGDVGPEALFKMAGDGFRDCGPLHPEPVDEPEEPEARPRPPRGMVN